MAEMRHIAFWEMPSLGFHHGRKENEEASEV
jgi:hypothetical protein